ncbi:MFS general substrate transporter [Auriscalpium vulgare]|uniref:MFS general substrate transporter n=1 Tax=Auriscalpium vulgare TaxID=40419 RepID=A0ACB8RXV7_9AGAM|nr:MFS general substrate transporter [Auriscalpium vulgare]
MPTHASSPSFAFITYHDPNQLHVGVRRAWMTLFGAWLAIAATFGYTFTFGVYQDVYTGAHVASAIGVRWIGATQLSLLLATSLPAGMLHDSGHFRSVITTGSCFFTSSLFLLSFVDLGDHYFKFFFTQGIVMGVGAGLVCIPSLAVQTDHWGTHSALAMGIASSGMFVGGTFFPIMLTQLLHNGVSFAWSVRASALVVLGMLLVANACMWQSYPRASLGDKRTSIRELVTDTPYMAAVIGGLFTNWGIYFMYFYLQLYVVHRGIDDAFAFYTPAILCGAAIPGAILSNLAAAKCGTFRVFVVSATGCGSLVVLAILPSPSIAGAVICAVLFGFPAGAWLSLLPDVYCTMSTSARECGVRLGFAFAVSAGAVLTATPINDALMSQDWGLPIMLSFLIMFAGTVLCITAGVLSTEPEEF